MAKRKTEFDKGDDNGEERAVFIDTSLDTNFVLLVSNLDTLALLKQKILLEHPKCFPDFGEIKINALKVKRKGCYYHMSDSMLVKTAFHGVAKNWFLFADASSEIAYAQTQMNVHAIIPARPTKTKVTLVGSSKLSKSDYCSKDDPYGTYKIENKSNPEMLKIECNSLENSLKLGDSGGTTRGRKKRKCKGEHHDIREHVVPLQNCALQQHGINCNADHQTLYIEHPSGDGDLQSSYLLGRHNTEDGDDHGKKLPSRSKQMLDLEIQKDFHSNSKEKGPPLTENHLKSVGNDTKWKNSVDDEALPSSSNSEKKSKARSVISDPNRATYEPETIVNKSDGENMQSSRLVGLNCLPSKVPKTKKATGKRKMQEIQTDNGFAYSEINEKQNLKDTELHAHSAFSIAIDATIKVESVQGSLGDGGNKPVKEVRGGGRQLEGTSTSLAELVNNEKETDIVGLARGSRAKKIKKAKKGDINGVNRSHPITSSKVPDILNTVTPSENVNTINDCEQDNLKVTEAGKEVQLNYDSKPLSQQDPLTLKEDIATLKSLDVNGILESENTAKRKITKKAKNSVTEKQELCRDAGNRTSSNGYAEDHNIHRLTDEGDKGKTINEIVVLGSTAKKKKVKKGKNYVAENPDLSSKESLQPVETNKVGENVEVKIDKPKKRTQKKQSILEKDSLDFPVKEQLGEKTNDLQPDGDLSTNSNVNATKHQRGEDHHKELNLIPPTEVKKLDKKQQEEKLDLPSSVDTSGSGHNMITSKKSKGSERTEDVTQLQDDNDRKTEYVRKIGTDSLQLQPPQVNKPEENAEIRSDKPKKRTQKKQTVVKDPPASPVEKQLYEETSKMAMPKSADGDLLKNRDINDSKHQKELSSSESLHEEFNDFPAVSGLAEVRKLNKQQASKQGAKKLDRPSSVDTSSNGPNLVKLKKMKGSERTSVDGAELCKSISEQKHMPKPSAKPPRNSKQGIETQAFHANPINSSVSSDSSVRRTDHGKKAKELQKKPDDDYVGSRRSSHKNMGKVNASAQRKGLLVTSGAIFEDGSSASSDGEDKMDGSGSSTRTPSDNLSSDNSEGGSEAIMVTSAHDSSEGGGKNNTNSNIVGGSKILTMESILRSSSKYRKAKLVATQSQVEDGQSQPVEFVPDSLQNQ